MPAAKPRSSVKLSPVRAAAQAVLHALNDYEAECLGEAETMVGGIGTGHPLYLAVESLRAYYAEDQLPQPGWRHWRRFMQSLRDNDDGEPSGVARALAHEHLDSLRTWLRTKYKLKDPSREIQPNLTGLIVGDENQAASSTRRTKTRHDHRYLWECLHEHHLRPGGRDAHVPPLSQEQLQKKLGWNQSKVSRRIRLIFAGGMEEYKQDCHRGMIVHILDRKKPPFPELERDE